MSGWLAGLDGGGTRSTLVVAAPDGQRWRCEGPAGLVDPRAPEAAAHQLATWIRTALADLGAPIPLAALCAGLAGVGHEAERRRVEVALAAAGVAERVEVVTDGWIALEGALGPEPGVLLVAGTGSVAYGRDARGRVAHCGGWGLTVGDEGSAYWVAREGWRAALRAHDGRGPATVLGEALRAAVELPDLAAAPSWIGRASKREVAALAPVVVRVAAAGDAVADAVLTAAAAELALHAQALGQRLDWDREPVPVAVVGGFGTQPEVRHRLSACLSRLGPPAFALVEPRADAASAALERARRLAEG